MNKDLLALIGNTPLVEIRHLNPNPDVKVLAKIECRNPGGSIKDRVAAATFIKLIKMKHYMVDI